MQPEGRVSRSAGAWSVAAIDSLDALPPEADALFADPSAGSLFSTREWYRCVIATALPAGVLPCLVLCLREGRPMALFPLQRHPDGTLQSLTTPYSCLYQPLVAADADADALIRIGRSFGSFCRRHASIQFEALDPEWPGLTPLLRGLRLSGMVVLRFDHFGNWHESVAGHSWSGYLEERDGALRETVRRKLARASRDNRIGFDLMTGGDGLEAGIAAFEAIYASSWKEPEPFPRFNADFMRMAAAMGILRLGVLHRDGQPIAAQYWVVTGNAATGRTGSVLKLAHDEAFKALSPGTVLTARMIRSLLEDDAIAALDFGRGDDPYKRQWVRQRRQLIGWMIANPCRLPGLRLILRHLAGRARRIGIGRL